MEYLVTWSIEIEADSPEEAAWIALATQRDPGSLADVFSVRDARDPRGFEQMIDLSKIDAAKEGA